MHWAVTALRRLLSVLWSQLAVVWSLLASAPPSPANADQPMPSAAGVHPQNPGTAFEPSDWTFAPVALIYLGLLVVVVISCFALIAAYPNAVPDVDRTLHISPPGPRLETDSEGAMARFRAEEDRRLNSYYWIDRQKGVVHVPIEQAMKQIATTGIPGFPKAQQ